MGNEKMDDLALSEYIEFNHDQSKQVFLVVLDTVTPTHFDPAKLMYAGFVAH